mmetsp:Transcript_22811/g.76603  ORF Transcript_22811/g.76603 Transcript_22811/m.76603 type:complete len:141 (-) Transcript_22811:1244-1666(-)
MAGWSATSSWSSGRASPTTARCVWLCGPSPVCAPGAHCRGCPAPVSSQVSHLFQGLSNEQPQHIQSVLEQANMFFVANRSADNKAYVYCSMCTFNGEWYLVEVATAVGTGQCKVSVRSSGSGQYNTAICDSVEQTLKGSA